MKSHSHSIENIWHKKITVNATFAIFTFIALLVLLGWQYFRSKPVYNAPEAAGQQQSSCPPPSIVRYKMNEYKFARPLLVIDVLNLGDLNGNPLSSLESGINTIIEDKKQSAGLLTASVYVRQMNTGSYIAINDEQRYHPASMAKVPVMMVLLRESEIVSGLLDKTLSFTTPRDEVRQQNYSPSEEIKPGVNYTIRDLIYRSIVKSDNYADMLLTGNMDKTLWSNLFKDLELPEPKLTDINYTLSATEYSRFMRMLYNATYISNEHADWALSILAQTEFKEGMEKELPPDVPVAHKFGEFGRANEDVRELHESGIIYIANNPVLITIMTRGKDVKKLPQVISEISKYVYDQMKNKGA